MYHYPLTIHTDDTPGVALTCRDIPEFNAAGDTLADALDESVDVMETALSLYVDKPRLIPAASAPQRGEAVLYLPAATVAKIELWNAMRGRGMRKADLCRLLDISQPQGDRLVDFLHASKIGTLETALAALGKRLDLRVMEIPAHGALPAFAWGNPAKPLASAIY